MRNPAAGAARLYTTKRTDTPFLVVFRDPTRREKSGRAKRVPKWFAEKKDALAYQSETNERLLAEGSAGMIFDATLRTDAVSARRRLDAAGHSGVSLVQLATEYNARVQTGNAAGEPIAPIIAEFLLHKETVEGCQKATIDNLAGRLGRWIDAERISFVGDITRERIEPLRRREGASANTRKNDIAAVSSLCTWLLDEKKMLTHHPVKGLKRPKVGAGNKRTFNPAECSRLLTAAQYYLDGKWLGTIAAMLFLGPRPSELEESVLTYGRRSIAHIQGGKMRGSKNRKQEMIPAAVAWLTEAGRPERLEEINSKARGRICDRAELKWSTDVCRHTFISNQLALTQNEAAVAVQAGTSVEIIHRHYNDPKSPAEAKKWAALRPVKS